MFWEGERRNLKTGRSVNWRMGILYLIGRFALSHSLERGGQRFERIDTASLRGAMTDVR